MKNLTKTNGWRIIKSVFRHSSFLFATVFMIIAMTSFINETKLTVTSTSFTNNGMIPKKYSCEGEEISPPLKITNVPAGAKSLALILHDPDAPAKGGFTHWVVWNINADGN